MAEKPSARSGLKRPLSEEHDLDSDQPPRLKRPRFPKGKKVRKGDEAVSSSGVEVDLNSLTDPRVAAKERAKRRGQITTELCVEEKSGILQDVFQAEEQYEDDTNFEDDGIEFEPFNLKKEREEGYFDLDGNFVEYRNQDESEDAWLASIDVDAKFAEKAFKRSTEEKEEFHDLSSSDVGKIKRRISNLLQPEETVLQALRRLKGNSSDRKEKMSEKTALMFDQLTEDAMKLMENDVYHDKREAFEREAEGYERLARAREGASRSNGDGNIGPLEAVKVLSNGGGPGVGSAPSFDMAPGPSNVDASSTQISSSSGGGDGDTFDMFGEDEETDRSNLIPDGGGLVSGFQNIDPENNIASESGTSGSLEMDYVYDESSGYYYSSSVGYYYDPRSGLYCSATSGRWYLFNERTGEYDEVQEASSTEGDGNLS